MLNQLTINNFAIIDEIELDFNNGLTVLTGETGAGKSIVADALGFLLGNRGSIDLIKTNSSRAKIEGIFQSSSKKLKSWLTENDFELDDINPDQIIVSREISEKGSKARINGSTANLSQVQFLRKFLLEIHEQSEQVSLLSPEKQLSIIDNAGKKAHKDLLLKFKKLFNEYSSLKSLLEKSNENIEAIVKEKELLNYQVKEIEEAELTDEKEEENLTEQRGRILNKKELEENCIQAINTLNSDDNEINCINLLSDVKRQISNASNYDKSFNEKLETIEGVIEELKEVSNEIQEYAENSLSENSNIEEVEDRLDLIYKLKRKYGSSIKEISEFHIKAKERLEELSLHGLSSEEIKKKLVPLEKEVNEQSSLITKSREEIITSLSRKLNEELIELGFKNAKTVKNHKLFKVSITKDSLSTKGEDSVEFLFSANPDEPHRPISKAISGGELSRVMLALKTAQSNTKAKGLSLKTLVFDEIDSGISGEVASSVSRKLYNISKFNQVICITHQPIVAAMADDHYYISKEIVSNETKVKVNKINNSMKKDTLAKLLTPETKSETISNDAINYAKSLIDNAEKIKARL